MASLSTGPSHQLPLAISLIIVALAALAALPLWRNGNEARNDEIDHYTADFDEDGEVGIRVDPAVRLEQFKSPFQEIEVLQSPRVGASLFIDSDIQLSTWDEFI